MDRTVSNLENLRIGDIVRGRLPTQSYEDGSTIHAVRNMLVLGLECVPQTDIVTAMHVARFSYNTDKFNAATDIEINPLDQQAWGIEGLRKPALLRTDRIDLIPLKNGYFARSAQIIGRVHKPEFFDMLAPVLATSQQGEFAEPSALLSEVPAGCELRQMQDPAAAPFAPAFNLAQMIMRKMAAPVNDAPPSSHYDDFDRALWQERKRAAYEFAERREHTPVQPLVSSPDAASEEQPVSDVVVLHGKKGQDMIFARASWRAVFDRLAQNTAAQRHKQTTAPATPKPVKKPVPKTKRIKPDFELFTGEATQAAEVHSPARLHEKGKKPSTTQKRLVYTDDARTYTPQLPENLKRGDILFLYVIDFIEGRETGAVSRPCVVWDVYEDDQGRVAGLDLLACTRNLAPFFTHKVETHNISNWHIWDGTHVIAEKLVRVPLTGQYFPPIQQKKTTVLDPLTLEKIIHMRAFVESNGLEQPAYGLTDIPAAWHKRNIETIAVSEKSLNAATNAFARQESNKPVITVPDIRPGAVIMRKVPGVEGKTGPALVWGVWHHRDTNDMVALDLMSIDTDPHDETPWKIEVEDEKAIIAFANEKIPAYDTARVDLVPNTAFFFDETANQPVYRLDETTMARLVHHRREALLKSKFRKANFPANIPYNWIRVAGAKYSLSPAQLSRATFAPDIPDHAAAGIKRQPVKKGPRTRTPTAP